MTNFDFSSPIPNLPPSGRSLSRRKKSIPLTRRPVC
nr:MAG TPA: hypothetical protein [Caudoviricetes sp.]